ncbi:glutamate racemase [Patescibacteria group bacterium]|nr:glutamate racemase [Patescibacteria group bacterium]
MIGIFDSGVGGLTVAKEVQHTLPKYNIIYFGDTARVPYGNRSREIVQQYSLEDANFLLSKGSDVIVIACHTASAQAAKKLRETYPQILIFDVIKEALKRAAAETKNNRIGIIGTRGTISTQIHENLLKKLNPKVEIFTAACPLFVPLVEEGFSSAPETKRIIKKYLRPLKEAKIDTLVLACTHYPLLLKAIKKFFSGKVHIIDPGKETALALKKEIEQNNDLKKKLEGNNAESEFFASDITPNILEISKMILGKEVHFHKANLESFT